MKELEGNLKNTPPPDLATVVVVLFTTFWGTQSYQLNSCHQAGGVANDGAHGSHGFVRDWVCGLLALIPLVCTGSPWVFRLPAAYAGRHPQWHRRAAGEGVWAPDTLFSRGVPFASGIFQLSGNHGLWLWRRVPKKNRDERLGTRQRLLSLAHPIIVMPEEEKRVFNLQLNHIQKKEEITTTTHWRPRKDTSLISLTLFLLSYSLPSSSRISELSALTVS